MSEIEVKLREQYDLKNNIEIHLVHIQNNTGDFYTVYLYDTENKTYNYSDLLLPTLKEGFTAFDELMNRAPINNQLATK